MQIKNGSGRFHRLRDKFRNCQLQIRDELIRARIADRRDARDHGARAVIAGNGALGVGEGEAGSGG